MEQPTLKSFDSMTIDEIEQELKTTYDDLLEDANVDADAWDFHKAATKALLELRGNFVAMRDLNGDDTTAEAAGAV